jgi:outer membrane autotransporter protein
LNEVEDNAGKSREFDNASRNEIEAGIRFAKRWVYPEAKAEIFFKPSIVQTINSGSQFELIEDRVLDSTEDLSLAKIEAGMSFDMIENWSASLGGSYSFGSDYQNTTANLSLIYNF